MLKQLFTQQERTAVLFLLSIGFLGVGIQAFQRIVPAARPVFTAPERISLNRAKFEELVALPGIGPVLARRIMEDRNQHGPYLMLNDLKRVKGITSKTLTLLEKMVRFD